MALLLLIGAITLCATVSNAQFGLERCFVAEDVCPSKHITFWFRTRQTGFEGIQITENDLDDLPLVDGEVIVIIHGYYGDKDFIPNPELVTAYLERDDYNIISVDWGKLAPSPCYVTAAINTAVVGRCTARLLEQLYSKRGQYLKQLTHVIGFSLGAHVAGAIGLNVRGLPWITGLDPARPGFDEGLSDPNDRLDSSDARFVEVYHSNSGLRGRYDPLGHVDIYINNGRAQPGCNSTSCSHDRSVEVFAESINNPDGFFGQPCQVRNSITGLFLEVCPYTRNNTIVVRVGEDISHDVRGSFKIETNASPPYARGRPE